MRLKIVRETSDSSNDIELSELIKLLPDKEVDLSSVVELENRIDELVVKYKNLSFFLNKGVFNLNAPISITANNDLEKDESVPIGSLYYDNINDLLRLKGRKGWRTV